MSHYHDFIMRADKEAAAGGYRAAMALYDQAIAFCSSDAEGYYKAALLHTKQGNLQEALAYFQKAAAFNGGDACLQNNIGFIYYKLSDYQKAEQFFRKAVNLKNDYVEALYGLGRSLHAQKKVKEAKESYQLCLRHDPKFENAVNALTELNQSMQAAAVRPHTGRGVFVGGCHRSGTSFITRALGLCGADLGSRVQSRPVFSDNQKGHWEDPLFLSVNKQILHQTGGSWDRIPSQITFKLNRTIIDKLLEDKSGDFPVFKDPRISILYPLYREWFPRFTIIAGLRNPMEVALSLQKRNGFTLEKGLDLWYRYNIQLVTWEEKYNEHFFWVRFPSMQGLGPVIRELGLTYDAQKIEEWFDEKLVHHEKTDDLPQPQKDLYETLITRVHS